MRGFFNPVTANNLDLIKKLKEGLAEAKRMQTAAEANASEVAQENKQLVEPLALVWISLKFILSIVALTSINFIVSSRHLLWTIYIEKATGCQFDNDCAVAHHHEDCSSFSL